MSNKLRLVGILLLIVCMLAGCGEKQPQFEEYSAGMAYNTQVYLDVVSVTPMYYDHGAWLCQGRTSSGDLEWITVSDDNYKQWFGVSKIPNSSDSIQTCFGRVRIYGTVDSFSVDEEAVDILGEERLDVLKASSVNKDDFDHSRVVGAVPISDIADMEAGVAVYSDVVSMTPVYYWEDSILHLVLCCESEAGEAAYYTMYAGDYLQFFSSNEKFAALLNNNSKATSLDILQFAEPVRLEGYTVAADGYSEELSAITGSDVLVAFCPADGFSQVSGVTKTHNYQPLSKETRANDWVYFDIVSITPEYSAFGFTYSYADGKFTAGKSTDFVICRCDTADGQEVWIRMEESYYTLNIDRSAVITVISVSGETITYDEPLRVYGSAHGPDWLASGLSDLIEAKIAIDFERAEK